MRSLNTHTRDGGVLAKIDSFRKSFNSLANTVEIITGLKPKPSKATV